MSLEAALSERGIRLLRLVEDAQFENGRVVTVERGDYAGWFVAHENDLEDFELVAVMAEAALEEFAQQGEADMPLEA
jgi:hypothetical protein